MTDNIHFEKEEGMASESPPQVCVMNELSSVLGFGLGQSGLLWVLRHEQ